ncbi:OmpA family protein [Pseudomonas sp. S 311-6]|jgi:peptidoglycan-associated lipoprotein|uniref:Peptidoglycan-associated lipoprotein n=1 Tax=Kerstersia gyiorum TaxID=206506 RepID=A0A171KNY5_9BURK|nr:OmpA family protein [Kerstersia gyiorum]AZV92755.1 peptidoglycan-associated lipoprotein [Bordetella sp. J329]MCO7642271.1 OmpA family protein [Pseudomonas sp. S 311-6]KAB0542244.1 OmpA family protein [Kerstersia gyiorum]KKO70602.1 membrane protein [Kerstersia gyiorum]MCH4272965.1 OmpA family protein [Kerstersia gyiorum]
MRSRFVKFSSLLALSAALAACSSVPLDDSANSGANQGSTGSSTGAIGGGNASGQILDPFNPQSVLAQQRSVFFEFDSYAVPEQYRELIETHAGYLRANGNQQVVLEGNTDVRGGAEYNLALGQRRAEAVRRMMTLLGVNDGQIETISLGKEKPRSTGTSEADHAENRRVDIQYRR